MRALLDACVLYPTVLRSVLTGCAARGLFQPLWSARILEEWRRAVLRTHPEQAGQIAAEIAQLSAGFAGAEISPAPDLEAVLSLPDPSDRHVLAGAIAGGADLVVTLNLTDFPGRTLARHGLRPSHPDAFLMELAADAPDAVAESVAAALAPLEAAPVAPTRRAILKRARLPRLARHLA
ncbi:MAG: PIN domain-containing protein [Rhodobacteraceae bacterium]|nr:PIN domain-containing protein [Paracoccaceae bacterium]